MEILTQPTPIVEQPAFKLSLHQPFPASVSKPVRQIRGLYKQCIKYCIKINILWLAFKKFRNPWLTFKRVRQLHALKNDIRQGKQIPQYLLINGRYFINYVIPGWPSKAFNRFINHQLNHFADFSTPSLATLIFAITKKCGFQCEHCCEWNNLNQTEVLQPEDLLNIIHKFHALGVSQIQISGGEPLNRFKDLLSVLEKAPRDIDYWLYTTGYNLSREKALILKESGLTGVTFSLDHYLARSHNQFRGVNDSFERTMQAIQYAKSSGLAVCLSICTTRDFVTTENLQRYMDLASRKGVSFVQFLEPKAVGHWKEKDVMLRGDQLELLSDFYLQHNFSNRGKATPVISYHGAITRTFGCSGAGKDYVYVDTDGDIHNCPFCQNKMFSALAENLNSNIVKMKNRGCGVCSKN